MSLQRFTRPITPEDRSLKLEVSKGTAWDGDAFVLRFPLENYGQAEPEKLCEAEQYARDKLLNQQNLVEAVRITPCSDIPNYRYVGDIGDKHLERIPLPEGQR